MRDSILESWLTRGGVAFEYVEGVKLADIVVDRSESNIRLGDELNDDTVLKYAIDLENGAQFPAIVLYRHPLKGAHAGKFGLLNGRHRRKAFELAKLVEIDAYIVKTGDPIVLEMLQRTVNTLEGLPLTDPERIEHALRLVALDFSMADAARLMGVKVERLRERKRYQDALNKLRGGGIEVGHLSFGQGDVLRLRSIERDALFIRATRLAQRARLGADELRELVLAVRAARDDAGAERVLSEWEARTESARARTGDGQTTGPRSPWRRLSPLLTRAQRIIQGPGNLKTMTAKDITILSSQISVMISRLQAFHRQLAAARRKLGA